MRRMVAKTTELGLNVNIRFIYSCITCTSADSTSTIRDSSPRRDGPKTFIRCGDEEFTLFAATMASKDESTEEGNVMLISNVDAGR